MIKHFFHLIERYGSVSGAYVSENHCLLFLLPATLADLAFRQPTFQISTDPEDAVAGNAVDGNPSTFAQTKNQSNPFWYVDLGESKLVRHLQITPHDTQREF